MGEPAEKRRRATYADLAAVPAGKVAELVGGVLHVLPRPALRHARTASRLGAKLSNPFDLGDGGPGGWLILDEPELHFPDPRSAGDVEVLVPDIAGWRREGVRHAWLVDPIARTLEVFTLGPTRQWLPAVTDRDAARVRAEPFDAIELALELLWAR